MTKRNYKKEFKDNTPQTNKGNFMLGHLCMYEFHFNSYIFLTIEFLAMCVCVWVNVIDLVKLDREI